MRIIILILAGHIASYTFYQGHNWSVVKSLLILLSLFVFVYEINRIDDKRSLIIMAYVYAMSYFISQLYWMFYSLEFVIRVGWLIAIIAFVSFCLFLSTYIAAMSLGYHLLKTGRIVFDTMLLLPSLWVLFEWLRGWLLSGFPWCEVGYTQAGNAMFRGIYATLGNYAVSWIILSTVGLLVSLSSIRKHLVLAGIIVATTLSLCCITYYIRYTNILDKPFKVALIQGNINPDMKWSDDNKVLDIYMRAVSAAAADLIVLPETAFGKFAEDLPTGYLTQLAKIAHDKSAYLMVGLPKYINNYLHYVNAVVLLGSDQYYAKHHLVPYGEYIPMRFLLQYVYKFVNLPMVGFIPGAASQSPLKIGNQRVAVNICYENGFATEVARIAKDSSLMLNVSDMSWYGDTIAKDEHLQMSLVRAQENQRYFAQETSDGLTVIINDEGRVVNALSSVVPGMLVGNMYGANGVTLFELYGNYMIVMLSCLFVVISLLLHLSNIRRVK